MRIQTYLLIDLLYMYFSVIKVYFHKYNLQNECKIFKIKSLIPNARFGFIVSVNPAHKKIDKPRMTQKYIPMYIFVDHRIVLIPTLSNMF